jgi:glycosyltransferase involved in cell wall biosynthesis
MKIGYDAKRAFHNLTGLGNYSRTLIDTLATYHPENQYHMFSPKPANNIRVHDWLKNLPPSVESHFSTSFHRTIHPIWRSYFIKNDIQKAGIQLFHGLSHELPLSMPRGVKSIVTMHDLIHERYPEFYPYLDRKIYTLKFKQAARDADIVVAISEQTQCDLIDFYNIDKNKIKVIYQNCDPQFSPQLIYSQAEKNNIKNTYKLPEKYLLYVGTINERKNLLTLIKALQLIDNQDIKLVVIGTGSAYFQKVKDYILKNKIDKRIVFLTKIDFADLPFVYQMAQVFILPSFFEGFGIPIIEALNMGCPIITTEGGAFKETAGDAALYINPKDENDIAQAVLKIINDESLKKDLQLRGYEHVKKFNAQHIGRQWISLYENCIQ